MRALFITAFFLANIVVANAASPIGTWSTGNGKAKVKVAKCGSGICAKIISLRQPNDQNGRPLRDLNNPKASLKTRKIIGISLFLGMRAAGNGTWQGHLYSPEKGGTFQGSVQQISGNILKVKGCLSGGFLCQSEMWKRIR